ncbi:MAG: hypothetical protein G4V63_29235 [Candidatus Afipia apatlaquensis]|jgi:hypothetical protein|uniref:Uncharacterized protein n=1 Tax=Candidatus Afipia apatlaquensis TaxID=2712852 RepID=A0A7C9RJV1_9BRAD|nr:hypothetical protein [Candidatus Afipia apatlaquensis]
MTDLSMNSEQVRTLLEAVARDKFGAEMMQMDAICYGGDLDKLTDDVRHIERILKAIPKPVVEGYTSLLRKEEADKLRAKADAIERNGHSVPERTEA